MRPEDAEQFSCLAHKTRSKHLVSILEKGLLCGQDAGTSDRQWVFLAGFATRDERNLAAGRQDEHHDIEILVDITAAFEKLEILIGANGCLLTRRVPKEMITVVHSVEQFSGPRERMNPYHHRNEHIDKKIRRGVLDKKVDMAKGKMIVYHRDYEQQHVSHFLRGGGWDPDDVRRFRSGIVETNVSALWQVVEDGAPNFDENE